MSAKFTGSGEVLNLYKQVGETPRERLERLRVQRPLYQHEVLSYAGRLDPMAEGVLVCLVGSANKQHNEYLNMSKEYVFDILFGFATDTYDILGKILEQGDPSLCVKNSITNALREFQGSISQAYPAFSSKTIEGKPLFTLARTEDIHTLVLPKHPITIYDISVTHTYKVEEATLLAYIESSIGRVQGDFRQDDILRCWKRSLSSKGTRTFPCATVSISCSSGTYVRSIAHTLGERIGIPSLALHILRTKVGEYAVADAIR